MNCDGVLFMALNSPSFHEENKNFNPTGDIKRKLHAQNDHFQASDVIKIDFCEFSDLFCDRSIDNNKRQ